MCGIAGYTHIDKPYDRAMINKLTQLIQHRGPDQDGAYVSQDVSLGSVRLVIIDLVGGRQPMTSDDGQTVLVYNGEIYNYREIRETLMARGHLFESTSDTEVLLHAFLEWDTDCFSRLKGMFAIAVWQTATRRLVLARDRMGIKPLYFSRHHGQIYFGSEMKVLLAHHEISRTLDLTAFDQYLSVNYVPGPRTMIEGIEKLPPGYMLEWVEGKSTLRQSHEAVF